jgi:predicted Zn-dependent peptidase
MALSNNITVIYEQMPSIMSVACGIFVKTGSRDEDTNTNGISHFIEHMLFKGTENRSAKQIADEMDMIGGQMNAFTTKEYTGYYVRTLYNHLDRSLDILSDMLFNSLFDQNEIKKECGVIIEEIDMYEDSPEDLVHDILQKQIYGNDTLGYSIIGDKDTISKFGHDELDSYFKNNYHQDNIYISVAGKFEENELIEKLERYFNRLNRATKYQKKPCQSGYEKAFITKQKDIEQVHLMLAFPGFPLDSEYSYDLAALNTFFGGSMSSRLFQTIREENGLSYAVYSYLSSFTDTGSFCIYAALNPTQSKLCFDLIIQEINRLFKEKVTEGQLCNTKEQLKSNYLLNLESSLSRMMSLGRSETLLGKYHTQEEIIEKIDRVNVERVYNVASKIFDLDKMSLSAVGKISGIDFKGMYKSICKA